MSETAFVRLIIKLAAIIVMGYAVVDIPTIVSRLYSNTLDYNQLKLEIYVSTITCGISFLCGLAVYFWSNKLPNLKLATEHENISSEHLNFIYNFLISALGLFVLISGIGEIVYYALKMIFLIWYMQDDHLTKAGSQILVESTNIGGIGAGVARVVFGCILFFAPVLVTGKNKKGLPEKL